MSFLAALLLAAGARAAAPALPVVDAHLHADFSGRHEEEIGLPGGREALLAEFARAGVVGAVAHTAEYADGLAEPALPGVVQCAGVREKVNLGLLKTGLASGRYRCVKIYLGYAHVWAHDRRYKPVYELAAKHGVPVVFHTGDTYSAKAKLKYADPLTIDEVAVDHPKTTFVIAHCGNPWVQSAAEVVYKNPNVYMECSALLVGDLRKAAPGAVDEYFVKPLAWAFGYVEDPKKLMFGSDWPLASIAQAVEASKKAIPKEHWRAFFHDNAARVFGLKTGR